MESANLGYGPIYDQIDERAPGRYVRYLIGTPAADGAMGEEGP